MACSSALKIETMISIVWTVLVVVIVMEHGGTTIALILTLMVCIAVDWMVLKEYIGTTFSIMPFLLSLFKWSYVSATNTTTNGHKHTVCNHRINGNTINNTTHTFGRLAYIFTMCVMINDVILWCVNSMTFITGSDNVETGTWFVTIIISLQIYT